MVNKSQNNFNLIALGNRVREIRKSLGMTQENLAAKAELDRSYIGGIERGERNVSFLTLCRLAGSFNCDVFHITKNIPEG